MPASSLKLPYARPTTLSDPCHDFTPEHCAELIAKPDDQLTWHDFQCILGPYLPAGTYEESSYFLPLAFKYILEDGENAAELVTSLVGFISRFSEELRRDRAIEAARSQITCCLDHWTSTFVVTHHVCESAGQNGRSRSYSDLVRNSEVVMETTRDLIQFEKHEDLAVSFYVQLANAKDAPTKSAWFLECVRAYLYKDMSRPPKHPEIQRLLDDEQLGVMHSRIVREQLPGYDSTHTYWQDTFSIVGTIGGMKNAS
jgi:hypothetical protein